MLDSLRFWQKHITKIPDDVHVPTFSLHTLRTEANTWLSADISTGRIQLAQNPACKIVLCVISVEQSSGYLMAMQAQPIALPGLDMAGPCLPVSIDRTHATKRIRFHHPLARNRRLGESNGCVTLDLRPPDDAVTFICAPVEENIPSQQLVGFAHRIARLTQAPFHWQALLDDFQAGESGAALTEALLHRLPVDEMQSLSTEVLQSARYRKLLAQCLGENPWSSSRLENLAAWRADRDTESRSIVSITEKQFSDLPGSRGNLSFRPQLGLSLNALARRAIQPRRMACVLGSARNEGPYLLEWIAHHRAIGFDHVFIYTNDNSDGSDELLALLARNGITWVRSEIGPQNLPQFRAYAHALSVLPDILDYRWTLIADLDEFLAYDTERFTCLRDYLSWQETSQADAVALPWLIYVAGAKDNWRDAPCSVRFTMREKSVNHHIKTIFRTNLFCSSTAHNPYASLGLPIGYKADDGQPHIAKAPENNIALAHAPRATHAWIAHYIFKSASDAVMKATRGKGDRIESERQTSLDHVMKLFVSLATSKNLVPDQRTARCAASLEREISTLRDIPGVAACETEIKRCYQREMRALCLRVIQNGAQPDESKESAIFRAILLEQRQSDLFRKEAVLF
jgi:hypothetical protein